MKAYLKGRLAVLAPALAALVMIVLAAQPARAAGPWYVGPGGNDGNNCLSPATRCATINGALNKPGFVAGDTIRVAAGTYTGTGDQVVLLNKNATLSGGWNSAFTTQSGTSTIDGQGTRLGISVHWGVTAVIERFTVQNGLAVSGGGIMNGGALTLNNSIVSGNEATCFGGSGGDGGGGIKNNGTLILNSTTVSGNKATSWVCTGGGGIQAGGTMTLNNSTVSDNIANVGGGIQSYGTLALNNSTVSGNTALNTGGGIRQTDGSVTLRNSIVAGNSAGNGPDCSGTISSASYNLIGNTSGCTFTAGAVDLTNVSARLGQMVGATGTPKYHPLLSGSLAINAGNPAGCKDHLGNPLGTDQRGAARVGRCDIGAYEYTAPGPAVGVHALGGTPQHTPPSIAFRIPLQALVLDSIGSPVSNTIVTFSAPPSGASGIFIDTGTFTTTATTNESGVATATTFKANQLTGSYTVTATVGGVPTTAHFLLSNVVWYVSPGGDDADDCQTPATACATVNGVLAKTGFTAGDTVLVATGIYTGTGSEVVLLNKSVILSGGWDNTLTTQSDTSTIDGQGSRRGITVNSGVTAVIERFIIQSGSTRGAGIYNDGTLTLDNSTVTGSSGGDFGGGIFNVGTLTLNSTTVSKNTASDGGGILNNGNLILNNSTISSNTASNSGGGIYVFGGAPLTLNNSTINDNTASNDGGGIYDSSPTGAFLQNTILASNSAGDSGGDCFGQVSSAGYNLIGNTSNCSFSPGAGDLTNIDAKLGPLQNNGGSTPTHALLSGSPAIDAGDPAGCMGSTGPLTTDQRGFARFGRCDIGAYEAQSIKTVNRPTALPSDPLAYTIASQNGTLNIANFRITDILPISLAYITNSLAATSGSYGYNNGVITWAGSVNASGIVTITFEATVSQTVSLGTSITNSAVISGGGEMITRTATVAVGRWLYLPVVLKNW